MNKAESERLGSYLELKGYEPSADIQGADLVIVNSCVVRQSAENRVINKLHVLKSTKKSRPHLILALTGCIVGTDMEMLKSAFPYVDHFFPAGEFPDWMGNPHFKERLPPVPKVTEYVPIMQGCNNFCSYCIVPYRRGRERSRPIDEIVSEVRELALRGVKEVTLLGQNVDSYGHDLPDAQSLAALLQKVNPIDGLHRIRFLTNHPKDMKRELIDAVASLDKVCEQLNLPVQAGDNDILKVMRRGYTVEHYRGLIREIRAKIPGISLSTDVIVGFPGETLEQFQKTYDLLSEIRFDTVHLACYSPRQGTLAAREMNDDVAPDEKKERLDALEKLQGLIAEEKNADLRESVVEVLVEGQKRGKWWGRTRGDKLVFFNGEGDQEGRLVEVRITRTGPWSLTGKPA